MMIKQTCFNEVLLGSAKEVFETMVFMDLAEVAEQDQDVESWALLSSITFKGGLEGCLSICCSVSCAQDIAMNMLGMESVDELTEEDTCDALGEIANMVMGSVKSRLLETVGNLEVSIPLVISGRELMNTLGEGAEKLSITVNIKDEYVAKLSLLYRESSK